jgi:hypothetical protein
LAKSSPETPPVSTEIDPSVSEALNVKLTAVAVLVLPILTEPRLVLVSGLIDTTVTFCETVVAAA